MIDICIPTYNDAKELRDTLIMFQNQTYKDYEIYVADYDPEGNRETMNVALEYNANVIIVDKKGIGYARHLATIYGNNSIILNWDADARFTRDTDLEYCLDYMISNDLDLAHIIHRWRKGSFNVLDFQEIGWQIMNYPRNFLPLTFTPGLFIKRDVYNELNGFKDIKQWEDVELGLNAFFHNKKISIIPNVHIEVSARRVKALDFDYDHAIRDGKRYIIS
ncbi:MAG: glycosyltransferase family A protein [Candidatus Nitrosocaldaceae archaeon]